MICCDHYDEWYHADCGVSHQKNIELEMKDQYSYICPSCTPDITLVNSDSIGPPTSSVIYLAM